MSEAIKEMADGLRKAMLAERTGYEFYKMAARNTQDADGKATFEHLAAEEQEHFEFLRKHYASLTEKGEWATGVKLGAQKPTTAEAPIFSAQLHDRIKAAHFEMSALAVAVQLELNGINHYKMMAEKASSPDAKKFFQELVVWETGHYDALIKQQQLLQEDYWNAAGFEPF